MPLSGAEQYLLELINRARLDPAAEAARYGVDLNAGLAAGTISHSARQVLAPDSDLELAAIRHSRWMIDADVFSHTGAGGSSVGQRATDAGYSWRSVGENLAFLGTTGALDVEAAIASHHAGLFRSAGHRANLMNEGFREIGLGQEVGAFTSGGGTYNSSLLTEVFGQSGGHVYVTGVAYTDRDRDGFYSVGEGRQGVTFASGRGTDQTESAGGYALSVGASAQTDVTGRVADRAFNFSLDTRAGNVKVDVVNGNLIRTSGDIDLKWGFQQVKLLGVGDLDAAGTRGGDRLTGNGGVNALDGEAGADVLAGLGGRDKLDGGDGADMLSGGDGNDRLDGGRGMDSLYGGDGEDRLAGRQGNDLLSGGDGADTFVFGAGGGRDTLTDLSRHSGDRLVLDDNLWHGTLTVNQVINRFADVRNGDVVFTFDADTQLRLDGFGGTNGLASLIEIL